MSKTKSISVQNFKAISEQAIDFNGCSAIITAGNNKGKTTLLRGIIDRIRGEKPELIVKQGEKEGKGILELTTGEKFTWEFDTEGMDKLVFLTKEGYKTKVTKEIVARFFPPSFDIDKFLNSAPKEQSRQLQKIIGIDFTEIDGRYSQAYNDRTEKNKEAERFQVKLTSMLECEKVDSVDLAALQAQKEAIRKALNEKYLQNKILNDGKRALFESDKMLARENFETAKSLEQQKNERIASAQTAYKELEELGYKGDEVGEWIESLPAGMLVEEKIVSPPEYITEMPDDKELQAIDAKILSASETNAKAKAYTDYVAYKQSVEAAKIEAKDADLLVKSIEDERETLIKSAKMPTGIAFTIDGITVDGFPLDKNQISTSKLYCAALRIASINIGEVRTLHFDASFLDKNTLAEIQAWANEQDLQLLIERPDFEGGEIKYELIENN